MDMMPYLRILLYVVRWVKIYPDPRIFWWFLCAIAVEYAGVNHGMFWGFTCCFWEGMKAFMSALSQDVTTVAQFSISRLKMLVQEASRKKIMEWVIISMLATERHLMDRELLVNRWLELNFNSYHKLLHVTIKTVLRSSARTRKGGKN